MGIWGVAASAIVMFASTNIDVAIVLVVCFANASEGKDGLKSRHVWIGQFIGFSILVVISLVGAIAGSFLPSQYAGLLGFVPLFMGLWRMQEWWKKDDNSDDIERGNARQFHYSRHDEFVVAESATQNMQNNRQLSISGANTSTTQEQSVNYEVRQHDMTNEHQQHNMQTFWKGCNDGSADDTLDLEENSQSSDFVRAEEGVLNSTTREKDATSKPWWSSIFSWNSLKMTAMTLSNGGDNVAVYISGLVTYTAGEILLTLAIFYLLLVLWLYVTHAFVSIRLLSKFIQKYGIYIIPIALVSLGIYILWSNDVLSMVCSSC